VAAVVVGVATIKLSSSALATYFGVATV
jgi:hypothetical protein